MSKKRAYIRKRRSVHLRCRQKAENARKVRSRQKPVQSPESASVTFQAAATLWHRTNVARYSKAYKTWTAEEVAAIVADQGEFTFDIPGDSTGAHQVKIVCTDAAGNEQTEEITNFYVTTNLFVRYYNNKPLFFGSIAAVVVIAGVVIALAAGKKKKNDKEK